MVRETGITCLVQPRKSRCTRGSLRLHFSGYNNDLLVLNCLKMERCVKSDDTLAPSPDKAPELIITRLMIKR